MLQLTNKVIVRTICVHVRNALWIFAGTHFPQLDLMHYLARLLYSKIPQSVGAWRKISTEAAQPTEYGMVKEVLNSLEKEHNLTRFGLAAVGGVTLLSAAYLDYKIEKTHAETTRKLTVFCGDLVAVSE